MCVCVCVCLCVCVCVRESNNSPIRANPTGIPFSKGEWDTYRGKQLCNFRVNFCKIRLCSQRSKFFPIRVDLILENLCRTMKQSKLSPLLWEAGRCSAVGSASESTARGPGFDTRSGHVLPFLLPLIK